MKKQLLLRGFFGLMIIAFLVWAGPRVDQAPQESFYLQNRRPKEPEYVGTITLYHVVSQKTYQGSVTAFLQDRAEAFNKKHFGVKITVEGMGEADFWERLSYGRRADMYSFFSGALYEELLGEVDFSSDLNLRPGLKVTAYGAPWCFSGYVRSESGEDSPVAALANGASGAMDLRAWGDRQRAGEAGEEAQPLGPFTDQVCYLGVDRSTSEKKAQWCCAFYEFLLSQDSQRALFSLGAFPVRADVSYPFGNALLMDLDKTYAELTVPDPFAYYAHKEQLRADALSALAGDEMAKSNFFQRLAIVIEP